MIKKVDQPGGGGSSGFIDKVKKPSNVLAIVAVIIVIAFAVAFTQ
jgi:hypothetical protein